LSLVVHKVRGGNKGIYITYYENYFMYILFKKASGNTFFLLIKLATVTVELLRTQNPLLRKSGRWGLFI